MRRKKATEEQRNQTKVGAKRTFRFLIEKKRRTDKFCSKSATDQSTANSNAYGSIGRRRSLLFTDPTEDDRASVNYKFEIQSKGGKMFKEIGKG